MISKNRFAQYLFPIGNDRAMDREVLEGKTIFKKYNNIRFQVNKLFRIAVSSGQIVAIGGLFSQGFAIT